jgi:hypothetical protein
VYNIQKAVSRLDYAPRLKDIQVTDIKKGIGVFTPKPDRAISFTALKDTLKKAGYTLEAAEVVVTGTLAKEEQVSFLTVVGSGQKFSLEGANLSQVLKGFEAGSEVEIKGGWKTVGVGASSREVIEPGEAKKAIDASTANVLSSGTFYQAKALTFQPVRFAVEPDEFPISTTTPEAVGALLRPAPIRVTSPGLTVYKGGAITPRLYFIEQHLGALDVNRLLLDTSISYTPSPRIQLEVEVPVSRTSFDDGASSGARVGLGNITLWSKYRFFRKVKTYGDRQAAVRVGFELPTGKNEAPTQTQIAAPAFVRQQLTPVSGGFAPHFDVAFSQAGGRFIFGGNAEGIWRSQRDGFRMGHEVRINTDSEYVLLPRKYDAPGKELFVILETTFLHRATGRLGGLPVSGSRSTEYYLAPGMQYAAAPRFVIEGSFQFPVLRNAGPLVLRTDRNILLGIKYLF